MTTETRLERVEDKLREVVELLNGGPTVEWERSIRGRLHKLTGDASAARAAAEALSTLRATEDRTLSRTEKRAVIAFGILQAVVTVTTLALLVLHG
jgi:hypothetical protein